MVWSPRVVVAAVIEKEGKYLVVEENIDGKKVISQPAGHLEPNESIIDAVKRETLEETGWKFEPTDLIGVMHLLNPNTKRIFIRFTFTGNLLEKVPGYQLDPDITATQWMTYDEIKSHYKTPWRGPLVMQSLDEYRAGKRYPMDLVNTLHVDTLDTVDTLDPTKVQPDQDSSCLELNPPQSKAQLLKAPQTKAKQSQYLANNCGSSSEYQEA